MIFVKKLFHKMLFKFKKSQIPWCQTQPKNIKKIQIQKLNT